LNGKSLIIDFLIFHIIFYSFKEDALLKLTKLYQAEINFAGLTLL